MRVVIKVGGTLLEDDPGRRHLAGMVGREFRPGREVLLVHGGGKQLTAFLEKSGVPSQFLQGLRVTSAEAIDAVVKVLAGTVNHSLLAALVASGVRAVGISGIDGGCLRAERLRGENGEDWGFVGKITAVDASVWKTLLSGGLLPVMACLAVGRDGQIYNVNADQAAVACAVHWQADALLFLTDVDGVRDARGSILRRIAAEEIPELIRSGIVSGGMLAKLNAVYEALSQGVSRVGIFNGHDERALSIWLAEGMRELPSVGTAFWSAALKES